jgi:16S rRNA (cytosine967-C5)-methyltransferase
VSRDSRSFPARKPGARSAALDVLRQWEDTTAFAEDLIDVAAQSARLSSADRALLNALVHGTIRNLELLDHWIAQLRDGKLKSDARWLLRLGIYQLLVLGVADHAAVNETVDLAGPARGLVNAVLRRTIRERETLLAPVADLPLAIRYSHPEHLIERWKAVYGDETAEKIAATNNEPAPIIIRANSLREGAMETIQSSPDARPVPGTPGYYSVDSIPRDWLADGLCYIQDPATALAPDLLAPLPGECVLDACAAPGGKTGILAQAMGNRGRLIATDASDRRCRRTVENLRRLGVTNTETFAHDWLAPRPGPPAWGNGVLFDRILLDVPCSNTGVIRRRVDVRWRLAEGFARDLVETQFALAAAVLPFLKPGGSLVYSTCSIEPEENEQICQRLLEAFSRLRLVETRQHIPGRDPFDGAFAALFIGA